MWYDDASQRVCGEMTTSSRLRTWYMVQFKGYTVVQRREVPRMTLGRLTYGSLWQLRPPNGAGDSAATRKDGVNF